MVDAPTKKEFPTHPGLLLTLRSDSGADELRNKKLLADSNESRRLFAEVFEELSGRALGRADVADAREPQVMLRCKEDVDFVLQGMRSHPIIVHMLDMTPDPEPEEDGEEEASTGAEAAIA